MCAFHAQIKKGGLRAAVFAITILANAALLFASAQAQTPGMKPSSAVPAMSPAVAGGASSKAASPTPAPAPSPTALGETNGHAVLDYLGQVIQWYRRVETQGRLAQEPAETLYVADNRQIATNVIDLAFEYARAQAALINANREGAAASKSPNSSPPAAASSAPSTLSGLTAMRDQALNEVQTLKTNIRALRGQLAQARNAKMRDQIDHQLANAKGELELAHSRAASLNAMVQFETDNAGLSQSSGFLSQIEELQRTVVPPPGMEGKIQPHTVVTQTRDTVRNSGILARAEVLLNNRAKDQTLSDATDSTRQLKDATAKLRAPLIDQARQIDERGQALATQAHSTSVTTLKQSEQQFDQLTARHKLVVNALLPLAKETVMLNMYTGSLERWRAANRQSFNQELRALIIRLGGLALLLVLVFIGALGWRELTFRYVHDLQRRHHLLALRRLTVIVVIGLIIIFDFANEIGALATVVGFAAAGIALALQNVIMSLAGYFYVAGRFGIKIGDRVQISGISGDVVEIGFFKMTLMEISDEHNGRQATGRIVVFPNSVVFQPTASFFKQAPGTSFTWNELRLTLAPDCDYRLAEKRLGEVVNQVFARYREIIQRQSRNIERELNLRIDTPRPVTRVQLSETGIELVLRYPVQLANAAQIDDEISRRLVDSIKREGTLKLVAQGTPALQPADPHANEPPGDGVSSPTPANNVQGAARAGSDVSQTNRDAAPVLADQTITPVKAAAEAAAVAAGVAAYDLVEHAKPQCQSRSPEPVAHDRKSEPTKAS
ncbi:MAG: mechanosensitive ion channel family protein [Candidatus Binataceae bacterium]